MSDLVPAWSEPFHAAPRPAGHGLVLPPVITPEWAFGDGSGRGVRVAVVDSGVEEGHPSVGAIAGSVSIERDPSASGGVRAVEGRHEDLYGHGTACAGIIRSVVPEAELVSVRVLGERLKGSARVFAAGLEWCLDHGIRVVNLSMSTASADWAPVFWELVDRAVHHRVCVVSAMNNERRRTIPSEFAGVFSVACAPVSRPDEFWCNPDGPAEWGALGIDVQVAWSGGGMLTASGNSFAAPVLSGLLARLVATHPQITVWQAKTVLAALAANAPDRP